MADNHDEIRQNVSEDYAQAVKKPTKSCCCSPTPKGVVAKLAGYSHEQIAGLPTEAVVNSFGCGNPLAFSEIKEGQCVLDLGSGPGRITEYLARELHYPTIGLDYSLESLKLLAKRCEGLPVLAVHADGRALPIRDGALAGATSGQCYEHFRPEDRRLVLQECARVLAPRAALAVMSSSVRWADHPSTSVALSAVAMSSAGSPGRLSTISTGTSSATALATEATTSRTLEPKPVPMLKASAAPPRSVNSAAAVWASARSATWM